MRCAVVLALLFGTAAAVTPIEKVIGLIDGLKDEVEADGKSEAKAYEEFACFCKKETGAKSKSVQKGTDQIGKLSASIADKTQEQTNDSTELQERKQKQNEHSTDLENTKVRCAKQKAEYQAEAADLSKAISGLKDAIKSMKDSKPSLLVIKQTLGMADAMSMLKTPKHKEVAAFLQTSVDPADPEFKFHSNDIINVCEELLVDYKGSKKDLDNEWDKTDKGCKQTKASLRKKMSANQKAMDSLTKNIAKLAKEIASHREDLITAQGVLQDDELYLKDLQSRCEDRANDYDQRSSMRNDELTSLKTALSVLKGTVKGRADAVNERALLQEATEPKSEASAPKAAATKKGDSAAPAKATLKAVSFLQVLSESDLKGNALNLLRSEGKRLHSFALTSLADRASADPFKKVKGLIQKLIERLLTESRNEASKKGFCDTELGKARTDRDFRFTEMKDLAAELKGLEAKESALDEEIKQLQKDIKELNKALKDTTKEREDEKKANAKTLKTAKEGLEGVNEALLVLKSFYNQAAKAALVQASPLDEDTSGPGFSGNYKGKQGGMKAVFALLETLASDFDRTLRTTEESEHNAHREYVAFSQAAQSSLGSKTTKQSLDEQDLKTTRTNIKTTTDDLQTATNLCDAALKELEELKPTCIDTGMSYAERVAKREEEIKALKNALQILAPQ